jgi:hypothetical protein
MLTTLPHLRGPAGAAFQLRAPATETIVIEHTDGIVFTRAGAPCVTVEMRNAIPERELRDSAWRVIQEALDIHAATHRQAFSTYRGDHEHALWILDRAGYTLVVVDVMHTRWSMNGTFAVTAGPSSPPPPPPPPPVQHHPALRFYRLSQLSEDLFDAYRNAYLALECLISDVSLKRPSESEPNWLVRVLAGPLGHTVPGGLAVVDTVERIYKYGRLPLFHAKTGSLFYLPQGDERAQVQSCLESIHRLLASIMHHRISPLIPCGWGQMAQMAVDTIGRTSFSADELIYCFGLQQKTQKVSLELVDSPRRFGNIWARVTTAAPTALTALESINLRKNGSEVSTIAFPELIPLHGVSTIRLELNQLESNVRAPNPLHPV